MTHLQPIYLSHTSRLLTTATTVLSRPHIYPLTADPLALLSRVFSELSTFPWLAQTVRAEVRLRSDFGMERIDGGVDHSAPLHTYPPSIAFRLSCCFCGTFFFFVCVFFWLAFVHAPRSACTFLRMLLTSISSRCSISIQFSSSVYIALVTQYPLRGIHPILVCRELNWIASCDDRGGPYRRSPRMLRHAVSAQGDGRHSEAVSGMSHSLKKRIASSSASER
ncbi:uncharacterized protein LAESUDRAFT_467351 [Laetiporus sulphureus 93-53]|uniref:Uncharacterized protein n=1 Tax=Laetiporus sulphureus 93-53 TaxID=1314785 RepID=A0A165G7Y4_9APHY|nr:uncharacterized protein LAESUDRAFT_467351 [Laetiporus sulphureus 93-53]KZT09953.1 hypothetical protein LAESUDRAFT_467351 [Laetiporus sulphureus 93-53]